jgi:hypothetical protein
MLARVTGCVSLLALCAVHRCTGADGKTSYSDGACPMAKGVQREEPRDESRPFPTLQPAPEGAVRAAIPSGASLPENPAPSPAPASMDSSRPAPPEYYHLIAQRLINAAIFCAVAGSLWYTFAVWRIWGWAGLTLTGSDAGKAAFLVLNFAAAFPAYILGGLCMVCIVASAWLDTRGQPPDTLVEARSEMYRCIAEDMTEDSASRSFGENDVVCMKSILSLRGPPGSPSRSFEWRWYRGRMPPPPPHLHPDDPPERPAQAVSSETIDWPGTAPRVLIGGYSARRLGLGEHTVRLYQGTQVLDTQTFEVR